MSLRSLLSGRMARADLLALAMILMAFPGLSAQAASEGGTDRLEIDDPPAPVGGAMINQAGQDGATLRAVRVTEPLEIDGVHQRSHFTSAFPRFPNSSRPYRWRTASPASSPRPGSGSTTTTCTCRPRSGTRRDPTVGSRTR